ncbi:hypothetical protein RIF29_21142 [Crotalaria pallida]|uniref:Leucine-rich repeat-containing N-terminal plant-type domain-containing protein n=1 Tax=Crotalaria pallida TaxID=3830 RepID=A0AAN9F477_CROPI
MGRYTSAAFVLLFLLGEICMCANTSMPCIPREREALLKFKATFYDISNKLSSWEGNHCCQWEGIACDNVTNSQVVKLDLSNLCLRSRTQNESMIECDNIIAHVVKFNLTTLFQSLRELVNLQWLDLSNNHLSGTIPQNFGKFVNLQRLVLSNNYLSGTIPQNFRELVHLQILDLSNNYLSGTIPQNFGELLHLQILDLSNNYLNGTIPQSLGHLTALESLILSGNKLQGNIPNDFDNLINLRYVELSSNKLDGIISVGKEWSSVMPQLWFLNLSYNHINGSLPRNIGTIMPNLESLLLGSNQITGSIPNSLCQIELEYLDLSKNKLSGEIPNCWRDTLFWKEINLSSNKLSGVFPSSFWNLSSLLWLHLNNNNLQGQLPMAMNALGGLLILDLGENQISGSIPSWTLDSFPSLHILRLRENKLSGIIPSQLCQLSVLKILDLSCNNLEGLIPWCLGNLTGMALDNSFHVAEGPSPAESEGPSPAESEPTDWYSQDVKQVMKGREYDYIKILKLVVNMDLSENKLVGSIPNGITLLTGLHGMNLSYNQLEGEIPRMIGNMISLESFDVSHNKLSGNIPKSMSSLTSLSHLNLSNNNFSGPIPIGNQFSTYDSSAYANNPYLYGHELPNKRPNDNSHDVPESRGYEDDGKKDKVVKLLFYFVIAIGFISGFWGVIGVLLLNKSWRHAYFRWVEDAVDNIYVTIVIRVAKLKKWMVKNRVHG